MAQNTSGTANSVNLGTTVGGKGAANSQGSGVIKGDSGQLTSTHVDYRQSAGFPTHTTKQAG